MAVFTPPFVLPVMAAISSRESPVARNCSNRLVPAGSRSSALSAILSASDCSISEEASLPSESHSGYTPLLTGPFLRQREMQLFFVVETAHASALRICTPSRLATQSRSSTSCTTSSGSPSSRDARKNFSAVARTLGLISVSSISSVLSILHRHRRKNRKKSTKFRNFLICADANKNTWTILSHIFFAKSTAAASRVLRGRKTAGFGQNAAAKSTGWHRRGFRGRKMGLFFLLLPFNNALLHLQDGVFQIKRCRMKNNG